MSIESPNPRDFSAAYYAGLHGFAGDPEAAEDLGIPVDVKSFPAQVASGHEVARLLAMAAAKTVRDEAQAYYGQQFGHGVHLNTILAGAASAGANN